MSFVKKIFYKTPAEKEPGEDKLWSSSSEFSETWKMRIGGMAAYIKKPCAVADFGCGMMWLESLLPQGSTYVPIDFIRRDERTIVLDLNRDPFPDVQADVAFMSGVLEYVEDVPAVAKALATSRFQRLIISYCTTEKFGDLTNRKGLNWVSHHSVFEFLSFFLPAFDLTALGDVNNNTLFVFDRKNEDRAV